MSNPHDTLRATLTAAWASETGASPEHAAMLAERDLDSMHEAETCPVCKPATETTAVPSYFVPCPDCDEMLHPRAERCTACSWYPGKYSSPACPDCGPMLSAHCPTCAAL